jgi:DNA-binding PadR family transcriptional regulator
MLNALQANGYLEPSGDKAFAVTEAGRAWFETLGVPVHKPGSRTSSKFARPCLDWTERRPHLAGTLGVSLYRRMLELGWVAPITGTRAVRLTFKGKQELLKQLKLKFA